MNLPGIYFLIGGEEKKRIEDRGRMVMIIMVGLSNTLTKGTGDEVRLGSIGGVY